jgi:hypothetical protein
MKKCVKMSRNVWKDGNIKNEIKKHLGSKSSLWIFPKSNIVIRTIYNNEMQKNHFKSFVLQLENLDTNQRRKKCLFAYCFVIETR